MTNLQTSASVIRTNPVYNIIFTTALAAILVIAFGISSVANANTFRWASQGDIATHDPHSSGVGLTHQFNGQIYEQLLSYDRNMKLVPNLATSWKQTNAITWVFTMREGVKFHDGAPLTVEDIVFSIERAGLPTSQAKTAVRPLGRVRKIDHKTFEVITPVPNPVLLNSLSRGELFIMNKAWSEKNNALKPQDFTNKEETFSARNTNSTGPFMLTSREPDVLTVLSKNPNWWGIADGRFTGNVARVEYRPIKNAATRMAALLSGKIDMVLDVPVQDVERLRSDSKIKLYEGVENRIIFVGMDQARDELLYSNVKGKNPFKDKRVRLAMYQAVDVNAIKTAVMRGLSVPTAINLHAPLSSAAGGMPASLEQRHPLDVVKARALLAEAGYPNGFEVTMDCPSDRYVNDEKICIALAAMWAKIGVTVKLNSMPSATYFPKGSKLDTSLYLLGLGAADADAMAPLAELRNRSGNTGRSNWGNYNVPAFDALIASAESDMEPARRRNTLIAAMQMHHDEVLHIPLHRQVIPWASAKNVTVIHRPDNWLEAAWVSVGK
jgi:peptide/nickel transport system substrate-binding protein